MRLGGALILAHHRSMIMVLREGRDRSGHPWRVIQRDDRYCVERQKNDGDWDARACVSESLTAFVIYRLRLHGL